jgi:hypothetical protein
MRRRGGAGMQNFILIIIGQVGFLTVMGNILDKFSLRNKNEDNFHVSMKHCLERYTNS